MPDIWAHVEPHFRTFEKIADGEITAAELLYDVVRGDRQCWVAIKDGRVVATTLTQLLKNGTAEINFCAGTGRHDWRDQVIATIEEWARTKNSKKIAATFRLGWVKEMKAMGFKPTRCVMEREIT